MATWKETDDFYDLLENTKRSLNISNKGDKNKNSKSTTQRERSTGAIPKKRINGDEAHKSSEYSDKNKQGREVLNSKRTVQNTSAEQEVRKYHKRETARRDGNNAKTSRLNDRFRFQISQNEGGDVEPSKNETEIRTPNAQYPASNRVQNERFINKFAHREVDNKIKFPQDGYRTFGYKRLLELSEKGIHDIIVVVLDPKSSFQKLFQEELRPDFLFLIMKVLGKICSSEFNQAKGSVLSSASSPTFLEQLTNYIVKLPAENNSERKQRIVSFIDDILNFLVTIIDLFPTTAYERLKKVTVTISMSMQGITQYQNINFSEKTCDNLENMCKKFSTLEAERKDQQTDGKSNSRYSQLTKPPDDFRNISIIPTFKDLFTSTKDIYLRKNIVQGSYENIDHYLDVQFRLLKEDFVGPLREGIQEYIKNPDKKQRINNIKIYEDVKFLRSLRNKNKCGYEIWFDSARRFKRIKWEYSKRFMFGSLLLFTNDNFKTFFFATVSDRDINKLRDGLVTVEVTQGTELPMNLFTEEYLMVESEVYFEPYLHVLSALQNIEPETFPMEDYIVHVNSETSLPEYFSSTNYSWNIFDYKVDVLDENSWPSFSKLKLDPSQYSAFKAALTNEFIAIQGPPGTGKTHIGLMIAEVLLRNLKSIKNFGPLLVICYTNHALDQFLEGLLPHTKNIIRIGGQSRSEVLKEYNLNEKRKQRRNDDSVDVTRASRNLHFEIREVLDEMTKVESYLEEILKFRGVLKVSKLDDFMTDNQRFMLSESGFFENWLTEEAYFTEMPLDIMPNPDENADFITNLQENETIASETYSSGNLVASSNEPGIEVEVVDEGVDDDGYEENYQRLMNTINLYDLDFEPIDITQPPTQCSGLLYMSSLKTLKDKLVLQKNHVDYIMNQVNLNGFMQAEITPADVQNNYELLREQSVYYKYLSLRLREIRNININESQVIENDDVWQLNYNERWVLYRWWVEKYIIALKERNLKLEINYRNLKLQYEELKQMEDLLFVIKADVVGITTTGAARIRSMLNKLKAKVVIVEEAAEVLEAHIVTSMTKDCQHVILIGDHEQLRPSTAVFALAKDYKMDISLFERMLRNGLGCYKLGVQHRMRPEFASLIVPTIYKELENHPSVENRPNVKGVTKNLFFITHTQPEDEVPDSASRRNKHEADFMMALCRHLLLQGYAGDEITVLATYSGQMQYMMREKRKNTIFREVRITVVDKFQGEENRIILLSLVRSNKIGKIGFLSIKNRVCVALSRARDGFFIIGNMSNLENGSTIWNDIKSQLEKGNHIGPDLTLRCEVHQNYLTRVRKANDFQKLSLGGCDQVCDEELICGHRCDSICHVVDREHLHHKCSFPCNREICSIDGHNCPKRCWEACDVCKIFVEKILSCGHSAKMPCFKSPEDHKCLEGIDAVLPICKHEIIKQCCVDLYTFKCYHPCADRLPCGHKCEKNCHKLDDPDHLEYKCMKECARNEMICASNHKCQKKCYEECGKCMTKVRKELPCNHFLEVICSVDLSSIICFKNCKKSLACGHPCKLKCFEKCGGCKVKVDKVLPECKHIQKNVLCSDEPNPKKCSHPCNRKLKCGHSCKRNCNQTCDDVKCMEIIETPTMSPCGHEVTNYECYMTDQREDLALFCKSPCQQTLICGHKCVGNCSTCVKLTFTLHAPCNEKCEKKLICGHICNGLCREICPPCNQGCLYKCEHKSCNKRCGEFCDPCKENCNRRCRDYSCDQKCSEICNIVLCDEICDKKLKCGHYCNGLCGEEICPACVKCFMYEDNWNQRNFILEDCGCEVSLQLIDHIFDLGNRQIDFHISMKSCPHCSSPIIKTKRYKPRILKTFKEIAYIKRKTIVQFEEITKTSKNLLRYIEESLSIRRFDTCEGVNNFAAQLKKSLSKVHFFKNQPTKHYALMIIAEAFDHVVTSSKNELFRRFIRVFEQRMDYINQEDIRNLNGEFKRLGVDSISENSQRNTILFGEAWTHCTKCKIHVVSSSASISSVCDKCIKEDGKKLEELTRKMEGAILGRSMSRDRTGGNQGRGRRGRSQGRINRRR